MTERLQIVRLWRMFFGRLFESDLMPPGLPQIQLVVWVMAFLGGPSALAPVLLSKKYFWLTPGQVVTTMEGDRHMALLLSMIATGLITLVIWENVFPDRRDGRILGVLPIRARTFVVARLAALLTVFALIVLAMTLLSSISFGLVNLVFNGVGGFLGMAVSHFAAGAGLEATVFFGIIALQCALVNLVGIAMAHRLAVLMQIAMVVGVLQMPLLMPLVSVPQVPAYAPLIGLATSGLALVMYIASSRRMTRLALEGTGVSAVRRRRIRELVPLAARITTLSPAARGVCAFTLRTVARSRQHRMLLAGWLGVALAIILGGWVPLVLREGWRAFDAPRPILLAAPLVVISLTLVGMRMLFAVPSEIRANWTLRSRQPIPVRYALDGAAAALVACVIPPVLLGFAYASALWGMKTGLIHAAFCGALGVLLAQSLAIGLDKVPFTCTYVPGKARFVKLWALYLTAFSFYTFSMASLETQVLKRGGVASTLAVLWSLALIAAYFRYRRSTEVSDLRFEEEEGETLTVVSVRV